MAFTPPGHGGLALKINWFTCYIQLLLMQDINNYSFIVLESNPGQTVNHKDYKRMYKFTSSWVEIQRKHCVDGNYIIENILKRKVTH